MSKYLLIAFGFLLIILAMVFAQKCTSQTTSFRIGNMLVGGCE